MDRISRFEDIVKFVRARLDDDEAAARAAARPGGGAWARTSSGVYVADSNSPVAVGPWDGELVDEGPHIARHDPARVLREVEAKREILEMAWHRLGDDDHGADPASLALPEFLALAYSDHPDYREQWRPAGSFLRD